jgi:signal transduction histidine kinase
MRQHIDPYLIYLVVALITVLLIGIFKRQLFNRLSTRIIALILISGPLTAFLFSSSTKVLIHFDILNQPGSLLAIALDVLITLGTPVALGLIAAYFVWRPLRHFNETLTSLKYSDYKAQVKPTGIGEFDEAFGEFNDLIHRLQHEEKLRRDLISDTSHELNTPLTAMIGQLTAIQEGRLPLTKERVATITEQTERLVDLVRQLDTYTKARMPDSETLESIHLQQFCKELISSYSLELDQQGITAKLHIAKDYTILARRSVLQQILTNLLQNTLHYSEATELTISAEKQYLTFSDNGKGVPAESLPYLFERFYRVDKSRNRASGGLGLGLAIVRELAESQDWTVAVKAGSPGLKFIIRTIAD